MNKKTIIEQLNKMPNNAKAVWMLDRIDEIEKDYEIFKDKLTDKITKFVDDILQDDLQISEQVRKYAGIGKKFQNFIQAMKMRIAVDDCVLSGEAKALLKEAKSEIIRLCDNIRKAKISTAMVKNDIKDMQKKLYIHKRLNEMQTDSTTKQRIQNFLFEGEAIDNLTEHEIDEKLTMLLEKD